MSSFYVISEDTVVDDVAVIAMGGELDYGASPQLREHIFGQIKAGRRRLVLDLSDVTFIDSTAIGVIVGAVTRLRSSGGGSLAVVCPDGDDTLSVTCPDARSNVRQIFHITGVDAGVALCRSREEALSELAVAG